MKFVIGIIFVILIILGIGKLLDIYNVHNQENYDYIYYDFVEINETPKIYIALNEDDFYRFFNITELLNESSFSLRSDNSFEWHIDKKCKEKYNISTPKFEEPWYYCREKLNETVFIEYNNRYYEVITKMP